MPVQSKDAYFQEHAPLHLGQVADGRLFDSMSGLPVAADIAYGAGVIRSGNKIVLATNETEAQKFIGVVMYEKNRALTDSQVSVVPKGFDCTVVTQGDVAVTAQNAVGVGDAVYLVHGAAGRGTFRNDANTDKAQILDGWEWKTAAGAGGIGVIGVKANVVLPTS